MIITWSREEDGLDTQHKSGPGDPTQTPDTLLHVNISRLENISYIRVSAGISKVEVMVGERDSLIRQRRNVMHDSLKFV